jgi:hypothetical protein
VHSTGAIYLVGNFDGTMVVDSTVLTSVANDAYVISLYGEDGQPQWGQVIGSNGGQFANAVAGMFLMVCGFYRTIGGRASRRR